jgi:hypothetical protein
MGSCVSRAGGLYPFLNKRQAAGPLHQCIIERNMRQNCTCISQWNRFPIRQTGNEHPFKSPHKSLNKCPEPRSMTVRSLQEQITCASWKRFLFCLKIGFFFMRATSLTRGWVCNLLVRLLLGLARAVTLRSKLSRTDDYIFLSHVRLSQPGGPGPFISPRNTVAQSYLQAFRQSKSNKLTNGS